MHKPTQEQIVSADYGSYPDDYKTIVSSYVERTLIDPNSMLLTDWRGPSRGYVYDYSGAYFGYRVCVEVNAKNRMGGYIGRQPFFFMLHNGRIIKSEGGYAYGTIGASNVETACNF